MAPWTLPQVRARPRHSCDSRATEITQREADARGRETGNRYSTRGFCAQCAGSHGLGQALHHATYRAFFPRASGQIPTCLMTSRVQTGGFQGHHAGGGVRHSVTRPPMQEVRLCKGTQDSRHQILTAVTILPNLGRNPRAFFPSREAKEHGGSRCWDQRDGE